MTGTPYIDPARLAELRIEAHKSLTARMAVLDSIGIGVEGEELAVTPGSIDRLLFGEPEQVLAEEPKATPVVTVFPDGLTPEQAEALPEGTVIARPSFCAITKYQGHWRGVRAPGDDFRLTDKEFVNYLSLDQIVVLRFGEGFEALEGGTA